MNAPDSPTPPAASPSRSPAARTWFWQALHFAQVRARFLIVLVVIGLVVGQWERLSGYWNWLTRQAFGQIERHSAVSDDTEFFCPMDPGVVSPWEDKCPICNMTLVRRKKGDAPLLPEGVVARMQLSPYRLQLAGVKTAPVEYRPLVREIVGMGFVRETTGPDSGSLTIQVQIAGRDRALLSLDQEAEARLSLPEAPPARARLAAIYPQAELQTGVLAEFQLENPAPAWQPGALATIVVRRPLADMEPYRSLAQPIPPLRPDERRVAYVSPERPDVVRLQPGTAPTGDSDLQRVELSENQRIDWWCPMHPEVFAAEDGHQCAKCNGMKLLPRIVTYAPEGHVLAVPASAVLDSGQRQLVFVEVSPGMLEGRHVQLGTRAGNYYPVLSGLAPNIHVVAAGAFLLDAETRLSGQASTAYFGATSATNP